LRDVDRFDLYELTVQSPSRLVPFLRAIHGREPRILGEDFAGTAAVSREWVSSIAGASAIAVDIDRDVLSRAGACDRLSTGAHDRLRTVVADVRAPTSDALAPADVIFAGNFSIGELATRRELVEYLRRSRARLNEHGVFVCDTYGGASAFRIGAIERSHFTQDGARIRYTWEQRRIDPLTARVENALHFRVERAGEIVLEITDAFVYRWRLWSVPEIRDALEDAGFSASEVRSELSSDESSRAAIESTGAPSSRDSCALAESFIVCVAGRI
jgi:hypothetical protein